MINDPHDRKRKIVRSHSGHVAWRSRLDRFALAADSGPRGKMNKAKRFVKREFSKKIRIKYRDRFGKSEK